MSSGFICWLYRGDASVFAPTLSISRALAAGPAACGMRMRHGRIASDPLRVGVGAWVRAAMPSWRGPGRRRGVRIRSFRRIIVQIAYIEPDRVRVRISYFHGTFCGVGRGAPCGVFLFHSAHSVGGGSVSVQSTQWSTVHRIVPLSRHPPVTDRSVC